MGVCEANIGVENDNYHRDGYVVIPDAGIESETRMSRTEMIIRSNIQNAEGASNI